MAFFDEREFIEVGITPGLQLDEKVLSCFRDMDIAPIVNSISELLKEGTLEENYSLVAYHASGKILFLNRETNTPIWLMLDSLSNFEKRAVFDLAIKVQSLHLIHILIQKYGAELNLRARLIHSSATFSYFFPISTKLSCIHQFISKLEDNELSLKIIKLLYDYESPTKVQLTEAACKAFRKAKLKIGYYLIELGASSASKLVDKFSPIFFRDENVSSEESCREYQDQLWGAVKLAMSLMNSELKEEYSEYFPIIAKHLFVEMADCIKVIMSQLDEIDETNSEEEKNEIEAERRLLYKLSYGLLIWIKEKLSGRKIQIKIKTVDKFFVASTLSDEYAITKIIQKFKPAFFNVSLNPIDKPNYYTEVKTDLATTSFVEMRPQLDIDQAYVKLAQGARFDCKEISTENLIKLKNELGELTAEEQNFMKLFHGFSSKMTLRHFTTNDVEYICNTSKFLFSYDQLQKRKVRSGGLTNNSDQATGNTDFVFFSMGLGKRFARWDDLRAHPYYFLFSAQLISSYQGWMTLSDWAAYQDERVICSVFGDVRRETLFKCSAQPFVRKKIYKFYKLDNPGSSFEFEVDRSEEVFFGGDVFDGICFSIIRQLRAMQKIRSSFPGEFYAALLKNPQYVIGQAIDQFFGIEVKLPCRVSMSDCLGVYDRHGALVSAPPPTFAPATTFTVVTNFSAAPQAMFGIKRPGSPLLKDENKYQAASSVPTSPAF